MSAVSGLRHNYRAPFHSEALACTPTAPFPPTLAEVSTLFSGSWPALVAVYGREGETLSVRASILGQSSPRALMGRVCAPGQGR